MRVGLLVNESGKALEGLAGLEFGDPIVTAFQEITDALWELIRTLQGPFDATIRQPRTMDIDVFGFVTLGSPMAPHGRSVPEPHHQGA